MLIRIERARVDGGSLHKTIDPTWNVVRASLVTGSTAVYVD
jgi:hypothetical protein